MTTENNAVNAEAVPQKAEMVLALPQMKVFTFDGATISVFHDSHRQYGPGITIHIVDAKGDMEPDEKGVVCKIRLGQSFQPAYQKLVLAAEREGIDMESAEADDPAVDWQRIQDLGDQTISNMIAEFDADDAEAELNEFRSEPVRNVNGNDVDLFGGIFAGIFGTRH